jgi:hypothetical protein
MIEAPRTEDVAKSSITRYAASYPLLGAVRPREQIYNWAV